MVANIAANEVHCLKIVGFVQEIVIHGEGNLSLHESISDCSTDVARSSNYKYLDHESLFSAFLRASDQGLRNRSPTVFNFARPFLSYYSMRINRRRNPVA